ncbi:MAG: hypothetical protein V3S15_01320 [Woeseiaceae bacterium]
MPFTDAEIKRIKFELGQNLLEVGSEIYVGGGHQIIEAVIQQHIAAEVSTTSAAQVLDASPIVPSTVLVADATGFTAGDRIYVDVDSRREIVTIQALSGTMLTAMFSNAHGSTAGAVWPISLEGPIPIVRDLLAKIAAAKTELASTFGEGALKRVDEVTFYNTDSNSLFGSIGETVRHWRNELAVALGIPNLWERSTSAGSRSAMY